MVNSVTGPSDQNQRPRIACVGDIMVDVDHHCRCDRLSQEGPWPVYAIERTERRWGGAGNVAAMTSAMGAHTLLLGVVGTELEPLPELNGLEVLEYVRGKTSTTKTRFIVDGRVCGPRLDSDLRLNICSPGRFIYGIRQFNPDAIIVADHGKGVVSAELMERLAELGVPLFLDPIATTPSPGSPPRSMVAQYPAAIVAHEHEMPRWSRAECIIWKSGPAGLRWCDGPNNGELPSACRNLVDPLGAGDQFIAALAYQRCLGLSWADAIEWANTAAGLQCERRGCQPVTVNDVESLSTCHAVLL